MNDLLEKYTLFSTRTYLHNTHTTLRLSPFLSWRRERVSLCVSVRCVCEFVVWVAAAAAAAAVWILGFFFFGQPVTNWMEAPGMDVEYQIGSTRNSGIHSYTLSSPLLSGTSVWWLKKTCCCLWTPANLTLSFLRPASHYSYLSHWMEHVTQRRMDEFHPETKTYCWSVCSVRLLQCLKLYNIHTHTSIYTYCTFYRIINTTRRRS